MYSLILLSLLTAAPQEAGSYNGVWVTTAPKRQLNGTMTASLTQNGDKWTGVFVGDWNGAKFSYTVIFTGPPDKLVGAANIDFNPYTWTGWIQNGRFVGHFTSPRYDGWFDLKK